MRINNTRTNAFIVIANSGSQRFDILSGPFTKNDQLTASPFLDDFLYIPEIPLRYAKQVLTVLNQGDSVSRRDGMSELEEREKQLYAVGEVEMVYRRWLEEMGRREEMKRRTFENNQTYTLGYVTKDVSQFSPQLEPSSYPTYGYLPSPAPVSATISCTLLFPTFLSQTTLLHALRLSQMTHQSISSFLTSLHRWWSKPWTRCRMWQRSRPVRRRCTVHILRIKFWVYMHKRSGTEVGLFFFWVFFYELRMNSRIHLGIQNFCKKTFLESKCKLTMNVIDR